ncbi:citryl-CoA lyase [Dactylosporangium sp. CA-233914]|uniref:citryl-CoA lyase n=1 Tax=Dactylosporangium sp. CA-233914 TaxID=3239934 RepID=UPI003D901DF3
MPLFTTDHWDTKIAKVEADDVIVRGERVTDLIGRMSYAEMMYLVLTGRRATPGQARVLDGLMVSVMDHGISPSTTVTRMLASYGVPIQVGVAAGVLTFGDIHGGAGQQLAYQLHGIVEQIAAQGEVDEQHIREAARELVAESRRLRRPLEGFGHPQHGADPRTQILLKLARDQGVYGSYCTFLTCLEEELRTATGRPIAANIDGAAAVLLLDLGLAPQFARLMLIAPRTVGLAAHYAEELEQGGAWRFVPGDQVQYTGPMPG